MKESLRKENRIKMGRGEKKTFLRKEDWRDKKEKRKGGVVSELIRKDGKIRE